jgi:hypothetical protein
MNGQSVSSLTLGSGIMKKPKKRAPRKPNLSKYIDERLDVEMPNRLEGSEDLFLAYHTLIKLLDKRGGAVHYSTWVPRKAR